VQKVREAAARTTCTNKLKQLGLACHNFEGVQGKFPQGRGSNATGFTAFRGWMTELLTYIEQDAVRAQGFTTPWNVGYFTMQARSISQFHCPSDPRSLANPTGGAGLTSYVGVTGAYSRTTAVPAPFRPGDSASARDGIFDPGADVPSYPNEAARLAAAAQRGIRIAAVTDGLSNTLMIGERPPSADQNFGWWAASDYDSLLATVNNVAFYGIPANNPAPACVTVGVYGPGDANRNCHSNHYYSYHSGGALWAMGDGSVRFLPYSAAPNIPALSTRDGGEVVSLD
jgi:hypothetical protein